VQERRRPRQKKGGSQKTEPATKKDKKKRIAAKETKEARVQTLNQNGASWENTHCREIDPI